MAVKMIEDAERAGLLKPGGTIIEGTSGNTGMGLAIAAVVKGYKCIFTTTDKQSKEKVDALQGVRRRGHRLPDQRRSRGPAVVLLGVVAARARESRTRGRPTSTTTCRTPQAHYEQTGPEIWEQTDGRVDAPGGRRRHRRHDQRRRPVPEGAEPGDQGVGHRHLRLGVQEVQGDRRLRQERDLSVHHRGHRRGLPAEERRLRRSSITSRR